MATDKKTEKDRSVEDRLKSLFELQKILSEIDRIRTLRGELPHEVKDLEDEIERYNTRIQKFKDEIADLKRLTAQKTGEIADRKAKIDRYSAQQDNVRNNREYDFLNKEIEFEGLEIELAEKNINEYAQRIEANTEEIKKAQEDLADNEHILSEKQAELTDIVSETKAEEENLRAKALELEPLIDQRTLQAFKRIRNNTHNGLGIVTVQRNACGGCFNRVPPQRQLEIKMHRKVIVCEYCGRIMIDGPLAGIQEDKPVEAAPKRRSTRAKAAPAPEPEKAAETDDLGDIEA